MANRLQTKYVKNDIHAEANPSLVFLQEAEQYLRMFYIKTILYNIVRKVEKKKNPDY